MQNDRLDVDIIEASLGAKPAGRKVLVYESTSSTNDVAWEYSQNTSNDGLCVFAETQGKGRGRRGNQWIAEKGQSVLCSMLLTGSELGAELLTIASAVATAEAIAKFTASTAARIKWPNDVVLNDRKVAGVLLESRTSGKKSDYVIGVGINCHQEEGFFEGADFALAGTSIDIVSGEFTDRNKLAQELIDRLDHWLEMAQVDSKKVTDRWSQLSSQLGHHVTVEYNQRRFSGNCVGVDPVGGLILQLDSGGVRMFEASQTSIVKHS